MNNDEKNIEIVSGNGDNLNISPVYDKVFVPLSRKQLLIILFQPSEDTNTKKNVIIPDVKK